MNTVGLITFLFEIVEHIQFDIMIDFSFKDDVIMSKTFKEKNIPILCFHIIFEFFLNLLSIHNPLIEIILHIYIERLFEKVVEKVF